MSLIVFNFCNTFKKTAIHAFRRFLFVDGITFANPHHDRIAELEQNALAFAVVFQTSLYDEFRYQIGTKLHCYRKVVHQNIQFEWLSKSNTIYNRRMLVDS
jgi:hypothetical protein